MLLEEDQKLEFISEQQEVQHKLLACRRVCHAAQDTIERASDGDGEVPRTEDEFGFQEAGVNQNLEEMRECYKTKREIGARTERYVTKIEGVGDVMREEWRNGRA